MAYCGHYKRMPPRVLLLALLPSGSKQSPRAGLCLTAVTGRGHSDQKTEAGLCPKLGSHTHQLSGLESSTPSQPKLEVHTALKQTVRSAQPP